VSHPKSIVFLGSKPIGYRCLEHLLQEQLQLNYRVAGILTQARSEFGSGYNLNELAARYKVPVLDSLDALPECDILYSVQYHRILKQVDIDRAAEIAVNLHMAPLPEYRGSNQFSYAILEGRETFGTTIHQMDARIDHGDMLFERRFAIPPQCWIKELYDLTEAQSLHLFMETLPNIVAGNYQRTPQRSLEESRGTALHFRSDIHSLKEIDLSWDADRIERHIRATAMPGFEPPYAIVGGRKVHLTPEPDEQA
jgi:methionyl-tRNA formyltransferase